MKRTTLLAASAAAAILMAQGAAMAADAPIYDKGPVVAPVVPAAPLWTWDGPYVGVFAGYAWGDVDAAHPYVVTGAGTFPYYGTTGGTYSLDDNDGFYGGGTLGYNWQSGNFVFGVEGELGYMGIDGEAVDPIGLANGFNDLAVWNDGTFYGAITGRVGFAMDQILVYAKGGFAGIQSAATYMDNCTVGATCSASQLWIDSDYEWETGYTIGGGVEWAFNESWSAKAEYMYFDFGDKDLTGIAGVPGAGPAVPAVGNIDLSAHTVKVGLNYNF